MSGLRVSLTTSGFSRASKALEGAAELAKNPSPPAKAAAEWLAGMTIQSFSMGGHDGEWAPLSKMTMFLRRYRSQSPRDSAMPGSDTGGLKGSFLPFVDDGGNGFGAGTNIRYAERFQDGGPSEDNTVLIGQFTRKAPATLSRVGGRGKYNSRRSGRVTVHPYFMHLKGGAQYAARKFFPNGIGGLAEWGYLDKVRDIFRIEFKSRLEGTA